MSRSFNRMLNDVVSLIKVDGQRFDNIKALVDSKIIFISDSTLPIEEGDKFIRELPNGLVETFLVIDRGYYPKFGGIDAHYQVKVQKETAVSRNNKPHTIIESLIAGDQINLSNIQKSAVTIKSSMENMSWNIGDLSFGSENEKNELKQLMAKLNEFLSDVPSEKEQETAKLLKRVEILLEEMNADEPDRDRIEITGESLLSAAKNLATVMPMVLTIAGQIVNIIKKMLP